MNCLYYLKNLKDPNKPGQVYEEYSLVDYIQKNYAILSVYNKFGDAVFDETNTIQTDVVNRLKSISTSITASRTLNPETQTFEVSSPHRMSVTTSINKWKDSRGNFVCREFNESEYRSQRLHELITEGNSSTEANSIINKEIKNWEHMAKMGDKVHKIAEMFFNPDVDNVTIYDEVKLPSSIITSIIKSLQRFKQSVGEDYVFLPELTFQTNDSESDPIIGRLDLVTVSPTGEVTIYDFKVSDKKYSDWSKAKKLTVDYQLAAYRQLLANAGIPVRYTSLNVIPIVIGNLDYENETFGKVQFDYTEDRTLKNFRNLAYPNGSITKIACEHIKSNIPEAAISSNTINDIGTQSEIAFGKMTNETPEEFEKRYVTFNRATGVYTFKDLVNSTGNNPVYITANSKEELREKVIKYLNERESFNQSGFYINVWKEFNKLVKEGRSIKTQNPFTSRKDSVNSYLTTFLSSYLDNPNYELLDGLTELNAMGIYAFLDKPSGIVNFVTLTNIKLTNKLKLNFNHDSVLANLYSSSQVSKFRNILSGKVGNAKLMETLLAINAMSHVFSNYKIGNINVINHLTGENNYASISQLSSTFHHLTKGLKIDNHFGNELQFADPLDVVKAMLIQVVSKNRTETGAKDLIYDLYASSNLNTMTGKQKIAMCQQLQHILQSDVNLDYNSKDFSNEYIRMNYELSKLIAYYQEIYFNVDHDQEQIGFSINRKKTIGMTGYALSNPEMIDNPVIAEITRLDNLSRLKFRSMYKDYKVDSIKRVTKLYESKGMSKVDRWTWEDAGKAYKNMFVRDGNGKITSNFEVKNPYDLSNDLTDSEREWLKHFLFTINKARTGIGYVPGMSIEKFLELDQVQTLIDTKEYFEIPLIQGTFFSKWREGRFKSWKTMADQFKESVDPRRITDTQEALLTEQQEDYTKIVNVMLMSQQERNRLLEEQDPDYWETNLELIEDLFAHAELKKEIFNNILPLIHNLKQAAIAYSYDSKIDLKGLEDIIDKYIRAVIFDEAGPRTNKTLHKLVSVAGDITRGAMLGFNFNSLIREPFQGFYMLMSRSMNRVFGDNAFTSKDALKAYTRFVTDLGGPTSDDFSLLELLNIHFGMTQQDVVNMAYNLNSDNKGFKGAVRRGQYWATTAPDFLNRMVFLTAQMIHDDCLDAYKVVDGNLVYDWKKDGRFKVLASGVKSHPDYKKQLAKYISMLNQFNLEGYNLTLDLDNLQPLPSAYTESEKRSIKSGSDSIFGYMDRENAMLVRWSLMGKMLTQFKMYFSATRERWLLGGQMSKAKGEWVHATDEDGNKLYYKIVTELDGSTTLEQTTEETEMPVTEWQGRFVEGMVNSVLWYIKYLWDNKYKHVPKEEIEGIQHLEYRKRNMRQMFTDLIWRALMSLLVYLFLEDDDKEKKIPEIQQRLIKQMFERSTDELTPFAAIEPIINLNMPIVDFLGNIQTSMGRVLEDPTRLGKEVVKNVAVLRFGGDVYNYFVEEEE